MKKTLTKLSKTAIILMLLLAIDLSLVTNFVKAASFEKKNIYQIDYCEKVLVYKGIPRGAAYVVYKQNGKEYPAYCVNPERIGVGETDSYDVNINGYISDVRLWRIITNGYPYKTVQELGVANEKEAYLATKQAIYCWLDNRNVYEYSGLGEAGERTVKALRKIWTDAENSTETKISNFVEIVPDTLEWKQDELNKEYVSKTYKVEVPAPITNFNVQIKGSNLPDGLIVADINNTAKTSFEQNEKFKILIPISVLKNNGDFEIKVQTQMKTKPVLYGVSPNETLQNYAITMASYEDSTGTYYEQYQKNEAQIKILKREKESKTPLKGVEFELLDSNKNAIYQSLLTDEKGEIILKDIKPGVYYLKEVRTLPGYVLYDELIKIDIHLNEQINVIINNSKQSKTEVSKEVTNIEVEKSEKDVNAKTNETNITKKSSEENITEEYNEKNIQKLPKTGM